MTICINERKEHVESMFEDLVDYFVSNNYKDVILFDALDLKVGDRWRLANVDLSRLRYKGFSFRFRYVGPVDPNDFHYTSSAVIEQEGDDFCFQLNNVEYELTEANVDIFEKALGDMLSFFKEEDTTGYW